MPFEPFQSTLTTLRIVRIPTDLSDEKHAAFTTRVKDAVKQQAALARSSDALLQLDPKIREEGDRLLIEHEPATPFDLEAVLSADERPDIATLWWITWSLLRALAAVEPKRLIHGGLQLRSVFIDRIGRVKLTDFGLASTIEVVCGRETRRQLVCDAAPDDAMAEHGVSGSWTMLTADVERENGWIAPHFAPEILAGGLRLNPTSDQFSLGVVLYQIAAGVHPLGAELSDPELFGYFVPEPYPLEDERSDWAETFKRHSRDAAMRADQPILDWAELVYRLLANEPGERFESFAAAEETARKHVVAAWPEALRVLGESTELLEQAEYDPFLTTVGPWAENKELPTLWRARLAEGIAQIERIKAAEAARQAARARLAEGFAALDAEKLDQARAIAQEVAQAPAADDQLRERAAELQRLCDEHEELIVRRAEELAQANLKAAREAMDRGEPAEARPILTGVIGDPLSSTARREEAEALLAEIEEREARYAQQQAEFETVKSEFDDGNVNAALERLQKLLDDSTLPAALRRTAETLVEEVRATKRRHDECLAVISEVEAALEHGDLAAAEETLATLPLDSRDPQIMSRRGELAEACEHLRQVLQQRDSAEEQLRSGRADAALQEAEELLKQDLSPTVRAQVSNLVERCRQVLEQIHRAQLDDALEALAQAEKAYQGGEVEQSRRLLSTVLPLTGRLSDRDRARANQLEAACTRCEEAAKRADAAERRLGRSQFETALDKLEAIDVDGLPSAMSERITALRARIDQAREAHQQQRERELQQQLDQVAKRSAEGKLDEADTLLRKTEIPPDLADRVGERPDQLRSAIARGRQTQRSLAAVDAALGEGNAAQAARLLDELTASTDDSQTAALPAWAVPQIDDFRRRLSQLQEAQRRQAIEQADAALENARKAIAAADHTRATQQLAKARQAAQLSPELQAAHKELAQAAAELEAWTPKLAAVERALQQDQVAGAYRDAVALLKQEPIPPPIEKRLRAVEGAARERIAAHRKGLTAELETLATELEQRGRHAKGFHERVGVVRSDELVTKDQQAWAAELLERFDALPRPRRRKTLPIAAGAAIVLLGAGVGWYMLRPGPGPDSTDGGLVITPEPGQAPSLPSEPPVVENKAPEQIAAALERVQGAYATTVAELPADYPIPTWQLSFVPDDRFPTTLVARDRDEKTLELAPNVTAETIEPLSLTDDMREKLGLAAAIVAKQPAKPPGPGEPARVAEPPWPVALAARSVPQPDAKELSAVFGEAASPGTLVNLNPPLAAVAGVVAQATVSERQDDNSFNIRLDLRAGAEAVSADFALELADNEWRPARDNAGKLRGLLAGVLTSVRDRVEAIANGIGEHYRAGELEATHQAYAVAHELRAAFEWPELATAVDQLEIVFAALPARWTNPGDYEESTQREARSGYPRSLTKDGRTLLLVDVAPYDPLWNEIEAASRTSPPQRGAVGGSLLGEAQKPPDQRRWYLFYVEAQEWPEPVDRDPRTFARQHLGRGLPTADEWLLAALALRAEPDAHGFLGGTWDWCLKDDQLWVCGGCDAIHRRYLPWPGDDAALVEVWAWLNDPLVSQPRTRGDGLAGVRTVFRPGGQR